MAAGSSSSLANVDWGAVATGAGAIYSHLNTPEGYGSDAEAIAAANAAEMLALAGANAARMGQIAGINATAIRNTGYANAAAIERAALRNGQLMVMEGAEALRRHVRAEQYLVGQIRVVQAASGWSVNEGTPRIYLKDQKEEAYKERQFLAMQQGLSLFTMLMNSYDEASVRRYAADQQAGALLASAAIEREIMMAEAAARYNAMIREGQLYAAAGAAGGRQGLGIVGGAALGASIGSAFPGYGTVIGAGVGAVAGGLGII